MRSNAAAKPREPRRNRHGRRLSADPQVSTAVGGKARRVESEKVGREEAGVGPRTAQGGSGLRQAWRTRVPLRTRRQEAAYAKRSLGRHYRRARDRAMVEGVAL